MDFQCPRLILFNIAIIGMISLMLENCLSLTGLLSIIYNYLMPSETWELMAILFGSLLSFGCLLGAFYLLKRKRLIDDCPTSKTHGVFIGLVEIKGTAESEEPLTSYIAEASCVQYEWQVDEHWSRTVHETYTDAKGHTHTRTRIESGWKKIAGGSKSIPFYLKDDTGVIRILPEGADIESKPVFEQTCSPNRDLYFSKAPQKEIPNTTHKRRFRETALPLHSQLYVMGQSREREDMVAAEIAYDKHAPVFLISTRTEKQLSKSYLRWCCFWLVLGLLFAIGGAVIWDQFKMPEVMSWQPYAISIGVFSIVLSLGWIWMVYNSLISLRNRVNQGWSQVDIQLKRRHDLIPNLVKSVEGFRDYESQLQRLMAELRSQIIATPSGVSGPDLKGISPQLKVVIEKYPELKASEVFLKLQRSLSDSEQRIALARDYFNDIVTFYNTRLAIIPDRFVASIARLQPRKLLSIANFERVPIKVKLAA
jgi:hypothetical protein